MSLGNQSADSRFTLRWEEPNAKIVNKILDHREAYKGMGVDQIRSQSCLLPLDPNLPTLTPQSPAPIMTPIRGRRIWDALGRLGFAPVGAGGSADSYLDLDHKVLRKRVMGWVE